ncbi:MAG: MarR family winged helix-turn-helix transcriptional regulator [Eubacteriales bacterium]|nr:MarR family winged helix-turn-helix transcriptional regulator [Eubacteriales bacterium]
MKYLKNTLKVKVIYRDWPGQASLPYLLTDRYHFQMVLLGKINALFVYPKGEMEPISTIKKHLALLTKSASVPVVLILNKCTARQRKALLDSNIAFVVENRQIYLPFMGVLLQEVFSPEHTTGRSLLPSAQMLLFYYIYSRVQELPMSNISDKLQLSAMSISRAVKQMEETGLLSTYKIGVNKIITSTFYGRELYQKSEAFLRSPVKKQGYLDRISIDQAYKAGLTALSEYSMLNPPRVNTFALEKLPDTTMQLEQSLTDADTQQCVQLWTYNPQILARNGCVDVLSLHQSLKNETDERIQGELEELLEKFWEDYHGKGI